MRERHKHGAWMLNSIIAWTYSCAAAAAAPPPPPGAAAGAGAVGPGKAGGFNDVPPSPSADGARSNVRRSTSCCW